MDNHLHVGIDFSQKGADFCLLFPDGQVLDMHQHFANSQSGYEQARAYVLEAMQAHGFDGLNISGEATSYYWLPFFWQLAHDTQLAPFDPKLYLLNPRWVHWFKRSFSPDDKTDAKDPFYIAERTRTRPPKAAWSTQDGWLPLRFYTRLRFHLVQTLTREKNYALIHLFLFHSAYATQEPFSNWLGVTSRQVLTGELNLDDLAKLPLDELAEQLDEWSKHTLPDPHENARRLKQVATESFPLSEPVTTPAQRIIHTTLEHITSLETLIQQVEEWIETEVNEHHPEVLNLATIPGLGLILAACIAAEIGGLERFFTGQKWDKQHKRWRPKNLRDVEDAVAKMAGLWWPRSDSGDFQSEDRQMAKTGNRYLRYAIIQAANGMRRHIPAYAQFYSGKFRQATKHKHKRALVLTARKSVGLFVGLLHRNEAFRSKEA
jgi:hypothetical protein